MPYFPSKLIEISLEISLFPKLSHNPSSIGAEVVIFSFNPTTHPPGIVFFQLNKATLKKGKLLHYISRPQNSFQTLPLPKRGPVWGKKACKIFQKGSELKYLFKNNHFETKLLICCKIAQHHSLDIFRTYSYPKNIAKLSPSPSPSQAVLVLFPASPSGRPSDRPSRIVLSSLNLALISKGKLLDLLDGPQKKNSDLNPVSHGNQSTLFQPSGYLEAYFPILV